jgi:hypothetical protein
MNDLDKLEQRERSGLTDPLQIHDQQVLALDEMRGQVNPILALVDEKYQIEIEEELCCSSPIVGIDVAELNTRDPMAVRAAQLAASAAPAICHYSPKKSVDTETVCGHWPQRLIAFRYARFNILICR